MKYETSELKWLFKELLKTSSKFTVVTLDPQFGDLQRGFEFTSGEEPYHTKVTTWFKQDNHSETKQVNVVPAKVLIDYLKLAITSAVCVEIYEEGEELTYVYGERKIN